MDGWRADQFAGDVRQGTPAPSVRSYPAGDGQEIVVYVSPIAEVDLDPALLYAEVAADIARRAEGAQQVVSMTATPIRMKHIVVSVRDTEVAAQFAVAVLYRAVR